MEVTDIEISEIKINSFSKNTKDLCKNTKTIIRLRLGDYRGIFTSALNFKIFQGEYYTFSAGHTARNDYATDPHTVFAPSALNWSPSLCKPWLRHCSAASL
jgi:hypothetical protein